MHDDFNIDDMIADTTQQGKFIKLPNPGDTYTGVFTGFDQFPKELPGKNGTYKLYTGYFENNETGEEQELGFSNAMLKAFKEGGCRPNTVIRVTRTEVPMTDRETNEPVLDDNDEPRMMTSWEIVPANAAKATKSSAGQAKEQTETADEDEVNIDDIQV